MDIKNFMDQLLQTGKDMAQKGQTLAQDKLNLPEEGEKRDAMVSGLKTGAAAAGVLALLLGTKGGRALGGTALKLGSVAAVGGLAYQMYQKWQNGELNGNQQSSGDLTQNAPEQAPKLSAEEILKVMLAASKADGHIDEEELTAIREKLSDYVDDAEVNDLVLKEMVRPLKVDEIAALAKGDKTAAIEIYLVSRLVMDNPNEAEQQYLKALQAALELPDEVIAEV